MELAADGNKLKTDHCLRLPASEQPHEAFVDEGQPTPLLPPRPRCGLLLDALHQLLVLLLLLVVSLHDPVLFRVLLHDVAVVALGEEVGVGAAVGEGGLGGRQGGVAGGGGGGDVDEVRGKLDFVVEVRLVGGEGGQEEGQFVLIGAQGVRLGEGEVETAFAGRAHSWLHVLLMDAIIHAVAAAAQPPTPGATLRAADPHCLRPLPPLLRHSQQRHPPPAARPQDPQRHPLHCARDHH